MFSTMSMEGGAVHNSDGKQAGRMMAAERVVGVISSLDPGFLADHHELAGMREMSQDLVDMDVGVSFLRIHIKLPKLDDA